MIEQNENQTDRQQQEPLLNFCKIRSGGITIQPNPMTSEISFNEVMAALIEKALEFREKAKAHEKPKLTWWKPKYRKAADDYCRAAQFHYQAGKEDEAQADLLCACDCYKKKRAWFSAAKALEQVITICLKKKTSDTEKSALLALTTKITDQIPKTVAYQGQLGYKIDSKERQNIRQWTFQAAGLHRKAGQPDACASLLEKVGRSLESVDPECTILMLEMAAETVETENRPFQAACYTSRLLRIALENTNLPKAVERARKLVSLYQESGHKVNSGKYSLMLFLLLLADKREREAIAVAREYGNYCTKEQNKVIDELLQGTQNKDEEMGKRQIHKALQDKTLTELDSSIKPVIEKLMPEHANNEQESTIASTDPSISGSLVEHDIDESVIEGERVAEAFSVLSQYFQTLSNNIQGRSADDSDPKTSAIDLIIPKHMSIKRKDSNTSSISKSFTGGDKALLKQDSNSDIRKMWFLDDTSKSEKSIDENKENNENQNDSMRGKNSVLASKKTSSILPSITLDIASIPMQQGNKSKVDNTKHKTIKSARDRSRSPSKFVKSRSTTIQFKDNNKDEPRKKRDSFQRTHTIHVDTRYSKLDRNRKAGKGSEDNSTITSECMANAAPVVVGAATVGAASAALLGIEMSKAKTHEKIGQNYIISEMYDDDNMDDFAIEAD